jgi:hypothetical protein
MKNKREKIMTKKNDCQMKITDRNSKRLMKFLSIVYTILLIAGCSKDPDAGLDGTTGLMKFSFDAEPALVGYAFTISSEKNGDAYLITNADSLPKSADVTKLKASFQTINSLNQVKVNGAVQTSGSTVNDFSKPVFYDVYAENGNLTKYKIVVNVAKRNVATEKYIFINQSSYQESEVQTIYSKFGGQSNRKVAVGLGVIISVLNGEPSVVLAKLNSQLALAAKYDLPISVKLDGEIWWTYRSDLWNWWDSSKPGYDPDNKDNVEWTGWNRDAAIKIGWLNWGRQIRMVPCPNLMSPEFQEAWRVEITKCVNAIKIWYDGLPEGKKYLFGGIVTGWESSIGMSVFHYPNGNSYLSQPESADPVTGINVTMLPSRGLQTLGYAAVKTAGIASSGNMTEQMQTEVVRRHLEAVAKTIFDLGIPRSLIFTHCGGWVEGESLYSAALNKYSCPGWSFYKYAADPTKDITAMNALSKSDAPYWGAVEWLLQGSAKTQAEWVAALKTSLANNCKKVSIYNWGSINTNQNAMNGIKEVNK